MEHVHVIDNQLFDEILQKVFIPSKLNHSSSYDEYEIVAKNYLSPLSIEIKDTIWDSAYLSEDFLSFPKGMRSVDKFYFVIAFQNFQCVLKNTINGYKPPPSFPVERTYGLSSLPPPRSRVW